MDGARWLLVPKIPNRTKTNRKSFKKLPALVEEALKGFDPADQRPVKLFFQDEGFGRTSDPVRCRAPAGVRPLVPARRVREYLYVYSAVCPSGGENFSLVLPTCNSGNMDLFLDEFSSFYIDCRFVMVMDRAVWYPSEACELWNNIRFIR